MTIDSRLVAGLGLLQDNIDNYVDLGRSPTQRVQVAKNLATINLDYWGGMVDHLIADPSATVRGATAISLGETGATDVVVHLAKLASDKKVKVRYQVALAVGEHSSEAVLPIVIKLLGDRSAKVRAAAFAAYVRLRSRYPGAASQLLMDIAGGKVTGKIVVDLDVDGWPYDRSATKKRALPLLQQLTACEWQPPFFAPTHKQLKKERDVLKSEFDIDFDDITSEDAVEKSAPRSRELAVLPGQTTSDEEPSAAKPPATLTRYVNTWFEGHSDPLTPLRFSQEYELGIEMSPKLRVGTFTRGRPDASEPKFSDQEKLDVVVAIVTDDFEVQGNSAQRIQLPKDKSKSSTIARFRVRPVKNNQDVFITVLFYQDNNLFHEALVGARVQVVDDDAGPGPTAYFQTRTLYSAPVRGQRHLNLQLSKAAEGYYRFILFHDFGGDCLDVQWCKIAASCEDIANLLKDVHALLQAVVKTEASVDGQKELVFFKGEPPEVPLREQRLPELYKVPEAVSGEALQALARAGRQLYLTLFSTLKGTVAEKSRTNDVCEALRKLSLAQRLSIQILSDDFMIPWNLLYDGEYPTEPVKAEEFWGFKHIIEELPCRTRAEAAPSAIQVNNVPVKVGMNLNRSKIQEALINPHLSLLNRLASANQPPPRFEEPSVLDALKGKQPLGTVEYFFCHAGTGGDAKKNYDQSYLGLTGTNDGLTLLDIQLATVGRRFSSAPLFFLNACESSRMDGRFYDGFVPQFLDMGASAVVGTDCEVPSLFGAHLGIAFLKAFFSGASVGEALLSLRQRFLREYQNPLGLIYRVFGNTDVHVDTPIL